MKIAEVISITARTLITAVTLIALLIGILMYADVSIPLERARHALIDAASKATGRDVSIDGEVRLAVSFYPTLVVDRVSIANRGNWPSHDLMTLGRAHVQFALLPILSGRLELQNIAARDVVINLEQNSKGEANWSMPHPAKAEKDSQQQPVRDASRLSIDEFSLDNIIVNYRDEQLKRGFSNHLQHLQINRQGQSHLEASLSGQMDGIPYELSATSDLLRRLDNGRPWKLDVRGRIGESPIEIKADLDTSGGIVNGKASLTTGKVQIGRLLDGLDIVQGLDLTADKLQLKADLKGASLDDIVKRSDFVASLSDGRLKLHNHVNGKFKIIAFRQATLTADGSKDVKFSLDGQINKLTLHLSLKTNALIDFINGIDRVSLDIDASNKETELSMRGNVNLPVSANTFDMDLSIKGKRIDHLNDLLASELPPIGPYALNGHIDSRPDGYRISGLKAVIGSSDLGGDIDVDLTGRQPLWKMNLVSDNFQLDDFTKGDYSLIPTREKAHAETGEENHLLDTTSDLLKQTDDMLQQSSHDDTLDIDLKLQSRQVYSGKDRLGDGELHMRADESSLTIDRLEFTGQGGKVKASMDLRLVDDGIAGHLKFDMDKFNYGIALHHLNPESDANGYVSAHVDVDLRGPDFGHSLEKGKGKIDFALWPKNIGADAMNIWAVNLFLAVLPRFSDEESRVNCLVAVLDMDDGLLEDRFLALDSTKVWVNGNLRADFPRQTVELSLFPHAKKARMFGLQTPLRIKGTFTDINAHITGLDLVGTYLSFITSPLWAPMSRIFGKQVPADASEQCGKLLDRDYLRELKNQIDETNEFMDKAYSGD